MDSKKLYGSLFWLLCTLFFLYEFFLRVFTGTLSANLIQEFSLTPTRLAWIGSFYYISYATIQIPAGILLDRFGVEKVLTTAIGICVLALFLFASTHQYSVLLSARFLMGAGSAFAFPSLLMIAVQYFSKKHHALWMGATQILGAIGPVLAGAPFLLLIKYTNNDWRTALNGIGILGIVLFCSLIFFSYIRKTKFKIDNQTIVRSYHIPTMLKTLLSNKDVVAIAIYAYLSYACIPLMGTVWGVFFLQHVGFSQFHASSIVGFLWLGLALGSPFVGMIADKVGNYRLILLLCSLLGLLMSLLIIFHTSLNLLQMKLFFFLLGVSGGAQTLSFALLARHVEPKNFGIAAGLNNTAVMLGGLTLPPLVGVLLHSAATNTQMIPSQNLLTTLWIMPIIFLLGLCLVIFFLRNKPDSV